MRKALSPLVAAALIVAAVARTAAESGSPGSEGTAGEVVYTAGSLD